MDTNAVIQRSVFSATILFVSILFLSAISVDAQLDPTFGVDGVATADPGNSIASFVLPSGKILLIGNSCGSSSGVCFLRLNENGTPDAAFGANGKIQVSVPYTNQLQGRIYGAARQPDGKIILVGRDSAAVGLVARYSEEGTLDTSFASGGVDRLHVGRGGSSEGLKSIIVQPDGKLLAAGYAEAEGSTSIPQLSLIRYLPNGTLDIGFGGNGTGSVIHSSICLPFSDGAEVFSLQSDGKIIAGNRYETDAGGHDPSRSRIYRFNADGTTDNSFTVLSFPYDVVGSLLCAFVQPDDKILVGTQITTNDVLEIVHTDASVKRYNPNGDVDAGFGTAGQVSIDVANRMSDQPIGIRIMQDGQILVSMYTTVTPNRSAISGGYLAYARLSPSGQITGKFLGVRAYTTERAKSLTSVLPDGRFMTVMRTSTGTALLARSTGVPLQTYLFHAVPFGFSNGAIPIFYRPGDGSWHLYSSSGISGFGLPDDILVPSDYIGGLYTDFAFFRPSNGTWYIARQNSGDLIDPLTIRWGLAGDIPVPADYDGDGKSDVAVFRPSNGIWYIRNSSDESIRFVQWGLNGDKPAVGDFDGDGRDDICVFRPSDGNWYIIRSSDGGFTFTHFGLDGDIPVQEDYDGDAKFDIAVYRPSNGVWYRLNSSDGNFFYYQWGLPGDIPVPADYDRDRKINIAVWRPSNGYWYIVNPDLVSMHFYVFGASTDIPLPGKF